MQVEKKYPSLTLSVFVLTMIAAILTSGIIAGCSTVSLLVVNLVLVAAVSMAAGFRYGDLERGMIEGAKQAMGCILILLFVGILIGTWIQCGTVPMLIYYGLGFVTPQMILPFTFFMCSFLSLCLGSSWGTAGTVGVACVSIGVSMGVPLPMLAGAAISGSILGDKLSPLSDTTILTSYASGTDLYSHVRSMTYTTVPSFLITLVLFFLLGRQYRGLAMEASVLEAARGTLAQQFHFSPILLLPLVLIIVMSLKKRPAIPVILISAVSALVLAVTVQHASVQQVLAVVTQGVTMKSGMEMVDTMLSKGGALSMMSTVCSALLALGLGGILQEVGYLHVLVKAITSRIRTKRGTVLMTLVCGIFTVMVVTNFYVSAVLMGAMFQEIYDQMGLHRSVLSRTIEEANTIILPLVPWNTSCAYFMGIFNMATPAFAPYMLFAYVNILVSVFCAVTGLFLLPSDKTQAEPEESISEEPALILEPEF